jgi:hypothetical protein
MVRKGGFFQNFVCFVKEKTCEILLCIISQKGSARKLSYRIILRNRKHTKFRLLSLAKHKTSEGGIKVSRRKGRGTGKGEERAFYCTIFLKALIPIFYFVAQLSRHHTDKKTSCS